MKRLCALLIAAALCFPVVGAKAWWQSIQQVGISTTTYVGPGDLVSGATAWWGLRSYNAAYATGSNSAGIVCDTSTFAICTTINILSNGKFDAATAAASSSCATSCVLSSLTDQTGNGHTATCSSAATCAKLTFNCINTSLPCAVSVHANNTSYTISPTISVTTGYSISMVLNPANAGFFAAMCCTPAANVTPQFGMSSTANTGFANNGTNVNYTMSAPANHSNTIVFNGASSAIVVDATATTGLNLGTSGGTITGFMRANALTISANIFEFGIWGSTAFNSTQYGAMCHNQFVYWATSVSC